MGFLTEPAVQAFIDPTQGDISFIGACSPDNGLAIGHTPGENFLSTFNFQNGAFIARLSNLGPTPPLALGDGNWIIGNDGTIYGPTFFTSGGVNYGLIALDRNLNILVQWGVAGGYPTGVPPYTAATFMQAGNQKYMPLAGVLHSTANAELSLEVLGGLGTGFWGVKNDVANVGNTTICAGPATPSQATAYIIAQPKGIVGTVFSLLKMVITNGAYDIGSWPTPNGNIVISTIKATYAPTDFDAGWSAITGMVGPAYDQGDGNLIIKVTGTGGSSPWYVAKLNATTGAVMWKTAIASGDGIGSTGMCYSRIRNGIFLHFDNSGTLLHSINTGSGADSTVSLPACSGISDQVSDDVLGAIYGLLTINSGAGPIILLNGTPGSFTSLGVLYVISSMPTPAGPQTSYTRLWGNFQ